MAKKGTPLYRFASIVDLLRTHPAASDCLEREARGDRLLAGVRDCLGPHIRPHCVEARVSDGRLTLTLDSPSWATRVRYQTRDLIAELGSRGIREVKIRTRPESQVGQALRQTPLRPPRLTPAAVRHLLAAAEGCVDPGIGDVLRRLARRQSQQTTGGPQGKQEN
jgi:hypothetical protein